MANLTLGLLYSRDSVPENLVGPRIRSGCGGGSNPKADLMHWTPTPEI